MRTMLTSYTGVSVFLTEYCILWTYVIGIVYRRICVRYDQRLGVRRTYNSRKKKLQQHDTKCDTLLMGVGKILLAGLGCGNACDVALRLIVLTAEPSSGWLKKFVTESTSSTRRKSYARIVSSNSMPRCACMRLMLWWIAREPLCCCVFVVLYGPCTVIRFKGTSVRVDDGFGLAEHVG